MQHTPSIILESPIDRVGRLVIPKPIRNLYSIQPGDRLQFMLTNEGILLIKKPK